MDPVGTFVCQKRKWNRRECCCGTLRAALASAVTHSSINFAGRSIDHNVLFCSLVFLPAAFDSIRGCGESIYLSRCHEPPVMDGGCSPLTLIPEKGGRAKNRARRCPVPGDARYPPFLIPILVCRLPLAAHAASSARARARATSQSVQTGANSRSPLSSRRDTLRRSKPTLFRRVETRGFNIADYSAALQCQIEILFRDGEREGEERLPRL